MSALTGTGRLIRLALRRDRIKLPAWILVIVATLAATIPAVIDLYGANAEDRMLYAQTTAASVATRAFGGPINGPDIGAIVLNESYLFAVVLVAFMSTLAIIRHTRQNEETGRAELIGSGIVGRHALLTAALVVAVGANIAMGVLSALALMAGDLPAMGSVATGAALAGTGIVFAGIAAVTAQLSENARTAHGYAAMAIGVAFVLRAIGDSTGDIVRNGTAIVSDWPSYVSPIGWGQLIHPYTEGNWGLFALFVMAAALFVWLAFFLTARRDMGMGLIAAKPGPAAARPSLLSTWGLTWRLQKGTLRGWSIGIIVFGLLIGQVVKEFVDMIEMNEAFAAIIKQMGSSANASDALIGAMLSMAALFVGGYALQTLQRLRSEEANGHLEPVLATGVSKQKWMLSHILLSTLGTCLLLVLLGISAGASYVLAADTSWTEMLRITGASFAYLPAVLVLIGFSALMFGLLPRLMIMVSWGVFAFFVAILQFSALLKMPQGLINLSPFAHIPALPAEKLMLVPLFALSALGVCLIVAGLITFRRRDVLTS
jgi:ABC-2 type transport system permease protein